MPIRVNAPNGDVVEFPDGTPDETIQQAMGATYGGPQAGAAPAGATPQAPEATVPAAQPMVPEAAAPVQAGLQPDGPTAVAPVPAPIVKADSQPDWESRVQEDWTGVSDPARQAWTEFVSSADYDASAAPGSPGRPLIKTATSEIPVGASYIDENGQFHDARGEADQGLGFKTGFSRPIDNAALWIENGLDKAGVPVQEVADFFGTKTAREVMDAHDEALQQAQREGRRPGMIGQVPGTVLGALPALLATRNPWLLGAAEGALATNERSVGGVAKDAAFGAVTGKVGDTAVRAVGSAVSPMVRDAVRKLAGEGVEMTPGQILGGTSQKIEDALTSFPLIGDIISDAKKRSTETFSKAAVNRALAPIGGAVPKDVKAGHDSYAFAETALGEAYDEILPRVTGQFDRTFSTNVNNLRQMATQGLQPDLARQFENLIQTEIRPKVSANGQITGDAWKELDSILGAEVREFGSSSSPHDRRYAQAARQLKEELWQMFERSNPAEAPKIRAIDEGWANLLRTQRATAAHPTGVFTPHGLRAATAQMSTRSRSAKGEALMQDLATAGVDVLPSSIPDSGTPTRAIVNSAVGLGLGGATITGAVNPWLLGGAAASMVPYTKLGGKVTQAALVNRPAWAEGARRAIDAQAPHVALGGAAMTSVERAETARNRHREEIPE